MTSLHTRCGIPHGVLFIFDPTMIVDIPEDTGNGPILTTKNCIAIWTVPEEDGKVDLYMSDQVENGTAELRLEADLVTTGSEIAFHNTSCDPLLKLGLSFDRAHVQVFTDHDRYPTKVICIVTGEASHHSLLSGTGL